MNLQTPQFLRLEEVLRLCAVSKSFVYREMEAGRFPRPVKLGRRATRWKRDEILGWMESRPQVAEETWS